jgi:glycosyltransferase involved in cell wall biosynthesis
MPGMKTISIVLTIYNKAEFLTATLTSLQQQDGAGSEFALEFVLVDDASTDDSLAVAEVCFAGRGEALQVIRNARNEGPARRLNQGIRAANGEFVFVFDADDIAPANVLQTMLRLLERERLDCIYGRSAKLAGSAEEAFNRKLPEVVEFRASDAPLDFVLEQGIVLPIVLARKEALLKAGGSDDSLFIQDESLALRLALASRRMGLIGQPCRYVLLVGDEAEKGPSARRLSANRAQQHHDQYFTYVHLLSGSGLTPEQRAQLARKAVSPWWKSVRQQGFRPGIFFWYVLSRFVPLWVLSQIRPRLDAYFTGLPDVRRPAPQDSR